MSLRFCIALAYNDPRDLRVLARSAEEAGFDGAILSDHLIYPAELRTPYPYTADHKPLWTPTTPWPDPFVAVGALASVTERLRFIVSVFVLPLRHPVLAAKAISTAAVMSDDRLVLGLGAGWMREEFEAVGQPFEGRGRRAEEALAAMRALWTGEPVSHDGAHYRFEAVQMRPAPASPIPVWGGGLSDVALRRAARVCDGWLSVIQKENEMPALLDTLRRYRADSPRCDTPFSVCAAIEDAYTLDAYRRLGEAGVTHLITVPWMFYGNPEPVQERCDAIRRFGDDVIARLDAGG